MYDYELPLETELVKWYIKRKSANISSERWRPLNTNPK